MHRGASDGASRRWLQRIRFAVLGAVLLAAAVPMRPLAADDYQAKLIDLDRRYTYWSFQQNPTYATDSGVHEYDALLADFSPAAQAAADAATATHFATNSRRCSRRRTRHRTNASIIC